MANGKNFGYIRTIPKTLLSQWWGDKTHIRNLSWHKLWLTVNKDQYYVSSSNSFSPQIPISLGPSPYLEGPNIRGVRHQELETLWSYGIQRSTINRLSLFYYTHRYIDGYLLARCPISYYLQMPNCNPVSRKAGTDPGAYSSPGVGTKETFLV